MAHGMQVSTIEEVGVSPSGQGCGPWEKAGVRRSRRAATNKVDLLTFIFAFIYLYRACDVYILINLFY